MIKRLDKEVSSRIAAGEVIERPSSVAKELIENSIDASARNITLYVEQGGKTSFVIEDDGCGISFEELPLALERYATSKITTLDDLERISTLGYRGEALSSVAAVSRMEIRSRERTSDAGGIIRCEGGTVTLHTETPSHPGTRIQVDDLFYNLPARRKFLKTASAELRRILQVVNDYALVNPELTFRVFSDGKRILELLPPGSTDKALQRRWGNETRLYSSETAYNTNSVKIWWNPIPDSRRTVMTIFVNGRRIQDPTIRSAVCGGESAAYGEWLVVLEMPPEDLDVNIHPAKEGSDSEDPETYINWYCKRPVRYFPGSTPSRRRMSPKQGEILRLHSQRIGHQDGSTKQIPCSARLRGNLFQKADSLLKGYHRLRRRSSYRQGSLLR